MRMSRFNRWILCWINLFQGAVGVISLGYYHPNWILSFATWDCRKRFAKHKGGL